jgi:SsrA-binding protein
MKPILNRRAGYEHNLLEKLEAGIVLSGNEIKSIREGKVNLTESFVQIRDGEAVLINAHISPYSKAADPNIDPRRTRKLLLNKREIDYLTGKLSGTNLTIVPTRLIFRHNYAKIEIALASGKKKHDKREVLKRKAIIEESDRVLREDKLKFQKENRR